MQKRKKEIIKCLKDKMLAIIFTLWLVTIVSALMLFFFPFPIITEPRLIVKNQQVKLGEAVEYEMHFNKNLPFKIEKIQWYLIDGIKIELNSSTVPYTTVGENKIITNKLLPIKDIITPGRYKMQIDLTYRISSLRSDIIYSIVSNEFIIIKNEN